MMCQDAEMLTKLAVLGGALVSRNGFILTESGRLGR